MSRRIVLRAEVSNDLHEIVARLDQSSIAVADRFISSVFRVFDDLSEMPGKGSPKTFPRSKLAGVRSWSVPGFHNHLIFYQTHPDAIIILAVIHGARNIRRILKGRMP